LPVEWSRLSGDTVETIVSVLICSEHPNAIRVRPSRGDGGIDLLVPVEGGCDVYQVKKFATNLSSGQKRQICESLARLEATRIHNDLEVKSWHLVMPLDPTNENRKWFNDITKDIEYPCYWDGFAFIESLAAKYPNVIAYYINGGGERLFGVVDSLTKALDLKPKTSGDGDITPKQLSDYLEVIQPLLDTDPFYRYSVTTGPYTDELPGDKNLVFSVSAGTSGENGTMQTIKIFPRFKEATHFRPIQVKANIKAEVGSDLERQMKSFFKFGTPIVAPQGTVDTEASLPGGIDGNAVVASLQITPHVSPKSEIRRLEVLDSQGAGIATLLINQLITSSGIDGTGLWAKYTDDSNSIVVEFFTDLERRTTSMTFFLEDITGKHPKAVLPALRFIDALNAGNQIAIGSEYGPLHPSGIKIPENKDKNSNFPLKGSIQVAEILSELQNWTSARLAIPEFYTDKAIFWWKAASQLLAGNTVSIPNWSARVCPHDGASIPEGTFAVYSIQHPSICVGNQAINIGQISVYASPVELDPDFHEKHQDHFDIRVRSLDNTIATMKLCTESSSDSLDLVRVVSRYE